jgi:hypothetical protein
MLSPTRLSIGKFSGNREVQTYGPTDNPHPAGWLDLYRDAGHLLQLDPEAPLAISAE